MVENMNKPSKYILAQPEKPLKYLEGLMRYNGHLDKAFWPTVVACYVTGTMIMGCSSYVAKIICYWAIEDSSVLVEAAHWFLDLMLCLSCHLIILRKNKLTLMLLEKVKHDPLFGDPLMDQELLEIKAIADIRSYDYSKRFVRMLSVIAFCIGQQSIPLNIISPRKPGQPIKVSFPAYFGFETTTWPKYLVSHVLQLGICFSVFMTASLAFSHFTTMCHHLEAKIRALVVHAKRIDRNYVKGMYNDEKKDDLNNKLRDFIEQHQQVLWFYDTIQDIYQPIFLLFNINSAIMICTFAYIITDPNIEIVKAAIFFTAAFPELLLAGGFCVFSQNISDQFDALREALYNLEWYNFPKKEKKDVSFILMRTRTPFSFRIFGSQRVTMQTIGEILQLSYSAFNMLIATRK